MPTDGIPEWQPGESEGYALPCQCGPGVRNLQNTASDLDYQCPNCGETFTAAEVANAE